jgi:mRNA interferase RelE/StbE
MDKASYNKVRHAINDLPNGDVAKPQGHERLYRLRVGDWRVVYEYTDGETAVIDKIGLCRDIYRGYVL